MDDEDFRALIALLERQLREVGAADIADERHYFQPDADDADPRLMEPQRRLVEILRAFDRYLAMRDVGLYHSALAQMNDTLRDEGPKGAVFELARQADLAPVTVDLGLAPDLRELRAATKSLISQILESRLPPRSIA